MPHRSPGLMSVKAEGVQELTIRIPTAAPEGKRSLVLRMPMTAALP
jgi:hypothetical protein